MLASCCFACALLGLSFLHLDSSAYRLLHAGFLIGFLLTLQMQPICSSETSFDFHPTAWRYDPEDKTIRYAIYVGAFPVAYYHSL
jgi:hypothetical protein